MNEEENFDYCKHETIVSSRIKDIEYFCDEGSRTVTIYIYHCEKCGELFDVDHFHYDTNLVTKVIKNG